MKKYPKLVQCDKRGQIVIPKEIRQDLGIDEGSGFYMFTIADEGILLKKVKEETLDDNTHLIDEIKEKADKIKINKKNLDKSVEDYKKTRKGGFELI